MNIQKRCPAVINIEALMKQHPTTYEEYTVLVQEAIRYNKLLNEIQNSLKSLQKAIKGEMVMKVFETMANLLFNNTVPKNCGRRRRSPESPGWTTLWSASTSWITGPSTARPPSTGYRASSRRPSSRARCRTSRASTSSPSTQSPSDTS